MVAWWRGATLLATIAAVVQLTPHPAALAASFTWDFLPFAFPIPRGSRRTIR